MKLLKYEKKKKLSFVPGKLYFYHKQCLLNLPVRTDAFLDIIVKETADAETAG